jgi:hypothetical protein
MVLGTAHAASITTGPVRHAAGDTIECRVVNVGKGTATIKVEGVNPNGSTFFQQVGSVPAGAEGPVVRGTCNVTAPGFCVAYCRFTANSKKALRGTAVSVSAASGEPVVAVSAQ